MDKFTKAMTYHMEIPLNSYLVQSHKSKRAEISAYIFAHSLVCLWRYKVARNKQGDFYSL